MIIKDLEEIGKISPMLVYIAHAILPSQMKKILITGAAGFIGFHLAMLLKKRGDAAILGYDNFNAYYDQNLKRAR
jgi:NADPH:quinone reductase-like Zn-dependent oxidoreductase